MDPFRQSYISDGADFFEFEKLSFSTAAPNPKTNVKARSFAVFHLRLFGSDPKCHDPVFKITSFRFEICDLTRVLLSLTLFHSQVQVEISDSLFLAVIYPIQPEFHTGRINSHLSDRNFEITTRI